METTPLSEYPVARTASPGRLRDAVDGLTGYDHAVVRSVRQNDVPQGIVNGLRVTDLSLVFVAYATPVSVLAPPTQAQVLLVIPLGPMAVEVAGHRSLMTTPFALSSATDTRMYPDPVAGALVASVRLDAITDVLRECLGSEREFDVDLAYGRPIALGTGLALRKSWLEFAAKPKVTSTAGLIDSLVIGLIPRTNYRLSELADWMHPPGYLVQAVRYLRHNLGEQISLARLSDTVGIGPRQLQLAFRAHLGCTAQEYLRVIRLERAHELLSLSGSTAVRSVASVSTEVGIPHQGRFAQYFSERFGVLPSGVHER